jgi:hypothetical protein
LPSRTAASHLRRSPRVRVRTDMLAQLHSAHVQGMLLPCCFTAVEQAVPAGHCSVAALVT